MTIQQCRYVLAIVKTGSFNEAAKQLFVAQSSLSVSIKALEQELNIKIFERSGSGVYLTEDGSEFVKYATQITDSDNFIAMRFRSQKTVGKLHIATQHYDFIADIFGNFLSEVSADQYRFSIKEIETHSVIQEVLNGLSDIGIIALREGDSDIMRRYLDNKHISFTPLVCVPPHVFVRHTHPLAKRESVDVTELQEYPYVSYEQGEHNSSYFMEEIFDPFSAEKHIEISDRATLMNLLLITDAYTVGTGIMPSALNKGDIVSIPLNCDNSYIIGYILNDSRKTADMTMKFIKKLQESITNITTDKGEEK